MSFKLDFNDTFENANNVEDGNYEVVISKVGEDVTPSGAEYVQFSLVIRNDVQQRFQNFHIFHKIWRAKADGKYSMKSFNTIGKVAGLDPHKEYSSFRALMDDYEGKAILVTVRNETSEYKGKVYENVNVKAWQPSKIKGVIRHQPKEKKPATDDPFGGGAIEISDDDLPF